MVKNKPHRKHLSGSSDLVTTYEEIRAGFVSLALEKNRRATPFVEQARSLKAAASQAKIPADLLNRACSILFLFNEYYMLQT